MTKDKDAKQHEDEATKSAREKVERNEAVQRGVPKEAEVDPGPVSINEPPGSNVMEGIPEPEGVQGETAAQSQKRLEDERSKKKREEEDEHKRKGHGDDDRKHK